MDEKFEFLPDSQDENIGAKIASKVIIAIHTIPITAPLFFVKRFKASFHPGVAGANNANIGIIYGRYS